jgi:hypothetical protein
MRRFVFFAAVLVITSNPLAYAQDSHYWDNQYGTTGELLGGLVVGTPNDLSATFYNPGWIPLQTDPSLLVTTLSAEAYSIRLKDALGEGTEPVSTTVTTSPGYLAGRFTVGADRTWQWAYSYLQKVKFEFDAVGIRITSFDQPPPANSFDFSGEAYRKAKANEYWYGLTFARKIRHDIGLGFSPYIVHRSHYSRTQAAAQGLTGESAYGQAYLVDEYSFWHVRLLAKIGLAVEKGNLTYGITLTTPSLGLFGSGKVLTTTTSSGLDEDQNGVEDPPYLSSNYQEDLSASWQSPVSLAGGVSYRSGASKYHLTVEWFNAVKSAQVMNPEPFTSQSDPSETNTYNFSAGTKSLINFGLAFEHSFNPKFSLFAAARSDFSAISSETTDKLQVSNWDLWHLTGGTSFTFLSMEFTTGLQFSFGSGTSERFINFSLDEQGDVLDDSSTFDIDYRRLKIILGFNLPVTKSSS